jgi:hypothetical protein
MTVRGNTLVVPDAATPMVRYNNTPAENVKLLENRVVEQASFDAASVVLPATGPRQ